MKKSSIFFFFAFFSANGFTFSILPFQQVEGFENCSPCDSNVMLRNCSNWEDTPANHPFVFSYCNDGIPYNQVGNQYPFEGTSYAGFLALIDTRKNFNIKGEKILFLNRQYMRLKLLTPLKKDRKYRVSFYLSLAEGSSFFTDRISMDISSSLPKQVSYWGSALISNRKIALKNTASLNDTINWVRTEGSFQAYGGETHLTIGVFNDDVTFKDYKTLLAANPKSRQAGCYY